MLVAAHVVGVAAVPLNVTVLVPCLVPKFAPAIVTGVPTGPEVCERPVTIGAWVTAVTVHVNVLLLVSKPSDTAAVTL
jgi:hypothetical protein